MICDARTCAGCRYLEEDDERTTNLAVYLANCQHAKCKVVRLVRQQISKLQNMQREWYLTTYEEAKQEARREIPIKREASYEVREVYGEIHGEEVHEVEGEIEQTYNEEYNEVHNAVPRKRIVEMINAEENITTASLHRAASPPRRMAVDRKWMLRILNRVRHRAHLILVAAAVGVIVWSALVYGVFLGATACGSGRICLASTLKYKPAKRSLF
ncbi:uncharacterized protein LOC114942319 [Nylanderia fulva]|uniref:uncharacterized protein LOC114942319 n=1 Tax=Nylanderia fulva TaxID=613905 RepID=UPI0010FBB797|nr:uncharacterized protein LOC114942319 [Nylanderia fulva]